jgi:glycosidase
MSGVEWFRNTVIYHIFIDRFAGFPSKEPWEQPSFLGGNIRGIIEKLPYLEDLGVKTLWISPFNKTSTYHGYHITDFYQVDPHFGNLDDIQRLIREVHQRKMYIIADFVPNHCSREHPYFQHAQLHKNSQYHDWFYFTKWPDEYLSFLSIKDIPKLNLKNQKTQEHIINAALYWLHFGFDGYRLDHVLGPSHLFWKHFSTTIKQNYPRAVLIGEAWMMGIKRHELKTINIHHKFLKWLSGSASDSLFKEYIGELDGVLDFKFQELMKQCFTSSQATRDTLLATLDRHYAQFPTDFFLPTFLDNHDMDRFLFSCGNDKEKLKQAADFQFSVKQPAIIYYGSETGMTQPKSLWTVPNNGDIQARQSMNWDNPDLDLHSFYKKIIHEKINRSL